jgi:hypothetical protein
MTLMRARFLNAVIPAKAGIHGINRALSVDPRFRGDDGLKKILRDKERCR